MMSVVEKSDAEVIVKMMMMSMVKKDEEEEEFRILRWLRLAG